MIKTILNTNCSDYGALIARLFAGIIIFPHGLQKIAGFFGGYGFSVTIDFFSNALGIPAPIGFLIIMGESFGAILLNHLPNGFFMNWFGNQQGEGFEYHLLVIGLSLIVLTQGGGRWSIDSLITKKLQLI